MDGVPATTRLPYFVFTDREHARMSASAYSYAMQSINSGPVPSSTSCEAHPKYFVLSRHEQPHSRYLEPKGRPP